MDPRQPLLDVPGQIVLVAKLFEIAKCLDIRLIEQPGTALLKCLALLENFAQLVRQGGFDQHNQLRRL